MAEFFLSKGIDVSVVVVVPATWRPGGELTLAAAIWRPGGELCGPWRPGGELFGPWRTVEELLKLWDFDKVGVDAFGL